MYDSPFPEELVAARVFEHVFESNTARQTPLRLRLGTMNRALIDAA